MEAYYFVHSNKVDFFWLPLAQFFHYINQRAEKTVLN